MRRYIVSLTVVIVTCAASAAVAQDARDKLEGWGPFRFGMTRTEAMTAVGTKGVMNSSGYLHYRVEIDGAPYKAVASFSEGGELIMVIVDPDSAHLPGMTQTKCRAAANDLIAKVKTKYGEPSGTGTQMIGDTKFEHTIFGFGNGANLTHDYAWMKDRKYCGSQLKYNAPVQAPPKESF